MPKPSLIPGAAEGGAEDRPDREQIAEIVTARLKSPVGQPEEAEVPLRLVPVAGRARAAECAGEIREERKLEALIQDILGGGSATVVTR